jgi:hypothetical protein
MKDEAAGKLTWVCVCGCVCVCVCDWFGGWATQVEMKE